MTTIDRVDAPRHPVKVLPRFTAIDGVRAWMAWIVVFSHAVEQAWVGQLSRKWIEFDLGGQGVYAFIIISGFVITHLLVERTESYRAYIIPRFMRLFPAFFICCLLGAAGYLVAARVGDPDWFEAVHGASYRALTQHFVPHSVAHLTMLHGLVPNPVLGLSQYAFIPPAWSVSLEWQFYLIAPFLIRLCRSRSGATWMVVLVVLLSVLYHHDLKDYWDRPSMFAGAAKWFLIGIACRLAAPHLAGRVEYGAAIGLGIAFSFGWLGSPALAMWFAVYSFILRSDRPAQGLERLYVDLVRALLESRPIQFLAERSYSTYLLHWPVLTVVGAIATSWGILPGRSLGLVMLLAVPITLILQEPIYRFVEVPGRALGRRWAKRYAAVPVTERRTETFAS